MAKLFSRTGLMWWWVAVIVVAVDHYSKDLAIQSLAMYEPKVILPFFNLTLAHNTGAAFSFLHAASGWQHLFLSGIAVLVCAVMVVWLSKLPVEDVWQNVAVNLIIGGALGNLWDRLVYHYVIDFFSFHLGGWHFAIFNIADSAICIGSLMLIWVWLRPSAAQKQ